MFRLRRPNRQAWHCLLLRNIRMHGICWWRGGPVWSRWSCGCRRRTCSSFPGTACRWAYPTLWRWWKQLLSIFSLAICPDRLSSCWSPFPSVFLPLFPSRSCLRHCCLFLWRLPNIPHSIRPPWNCLPNFWDEFLPIWLQIICSSWICRVIIFPLCGTCECSSLLDWEWWGKFI